jgi:hypothetical protein
MADNIYTFMPADEGSTAIEKAEVPRMQLSEVGYTGLKISSGRIYEDLKRELTFPDSCITYKQMSYDPTIAAGLMYFESQMVNANWRVAAPVDATEEEKKQAEIVEQMMGDMEHTWSDFIKEASSMNVYGFAPHEIVLRKRLYSKGSKYNDGLVGWQKLPIRSQDTISKWVYSEDGRDLVALEQTVNVSGTNGRYTTLVSGKPITIPRQKFLLFRTGSKRDNPEGTSLLKACYYPWRYRTAIEETEAVGVARDLNGLPVIYIPPQYMAPDATPEQKAIYEYYKNMGRNIQVNQQGCAIMPMAYDPDTKQPLFKFDLMSAQGGKNFDTSAIITRYDNKILTAMCCDILVLGQGSTGSYALGGIKQGMTALAIESRLKEIQDVVNHHLIPLTARYNGWNSARLPKIYFDDIEASSIDDLGKFIQRTGAVGYLPKTLDVVNKILETVGVPELPEGTDFEALLPESKSKSGSGMESGLPSGTGDATGAAGDASSINSENAS